MIVAAASGAIVGDNLGFLIGREVGSRLLYRYGRLLHLNERKLKLGQYLFLKHGGKVVFFGRFVAMLRAWAALLAGMNCMRWADFLLFNALGGLAWATLIGGGGYWLGETMHRLKGPVALTSFVLAALVIIAFVLFVRSNEQRLEEEAEKALPGPLEAYQPEARKGQTRRLCVPLLVSSQEEKAPTPYTGNEPQTTHEESKDRAEPEKEDIYGSKRTLKV